MCTKSMWWQSFENTIWDYNGRKYYGMCNISCSFTMLVHFVVFLLYRVPSWISYHPLSMYNVSMRSFHTANVGMYLCVGVCCNLTGREYIQQLLVESLLYWPIWNEKTCNNTGFVKTSILTIADYASMLRCDGHGPLARHVKLWVVHSPEMPETFSATPRVSDPGMHHGTCVVAIWEDAHGLLVS